jgi:hypothetical protein
MDLHGLPFTEWRFDAVGTQADEAVDPPFASRVNDLIVMAHGWNNAPWRAEELYQDFFGAVCLAADTVGTSLARVGVIGVYWPSMRWPDEAPRRAASGTAALAGDGDELLVDLVTAFPNHQDVLSELLELLNARPDDPAALARFQALLAGLDEGTDVTDAAEDNGESAGILEQPPDVVFARFGRMLPSRSGPAAGADPSRVAWDGAREAMRQLTYYQMKKRAGHVGACGLGPALATLSGHYPSLRIHLVGHSFGARLVSYALTGLSVATAGEPPVKSVTLVQGAFSHYAFAASLPHAPERAGALAGMQKRVDGALFVSHSRRDTAVGVFYPRASWLKREDAAGLGAAGARWGAMGYDGAQAVDAREETLSAVGTNYPVEQHSFVNLDANSVICKGKFPSGAHSDIHHPEVGWAVLCAAGIR